MLGASLQTKKKPLVAVLSAELGAASASTDVESYRSDAKKIVCANCKQIFTPKRSSRRFCSDSCRKRAWDKRKLIGILIETLEEVLNRLTEQEVPSKKHELQEQGAGMGAGPVIPGPAPTQRND